MAAIESATDHEQREVDITNVIIEAIADAKSVPPEEIDACLYDVIEPEALDRLFQQGDDGPVTSGFVSFDFYEYTVTVHSDSTVEVNESTP